MNIRDLKYLVALGRLKHFSQAAQFCCVSQPTLSAQIKKLEDELGIKLFERHQKKVWPTEAGIAIVQQAQRVLHELQQIKGMAEGFKNPLSGDYRLGVIPTIGPYLLPKLLPSIREQLPALSLKMIEDKTENLCAMLQNGTLDAILLAAPIDTDACEVFPLFHEPILTLLPESHALAKHDGAVSVDELKLEEIMLLEDGHCLRDQTMQICAIDHRSALHLPSSSSVETLRQMVALGHGIALLPSLPIAMSAHDPLVVIKPICHPQPYREIILVTTRHHAKRACAEHLSVMIRQMYGDLESLSLSVAA